MIGLVTDSNSQLPPELAERYRVAVVPLTVTLEGVAYLEGEDLGADDFYARFEASSPVVSTSQPSAGQFGRAYRALAAQGADAILSIHVGSSVSGTVNAARLGAGSSPVPVRVVDSGTASFGVACCVWEAAEALAGGAPLEDAALLAERTGLGMGSVWVVGALELAQSGGRLAETHAGTVPPALKGRAGPGTGIPVLRMANGVMAVIGRAGDVEEAAEAMASAVRAWARPPVASSPEGTVPPALKGRSGPGPLLRVGVGLADRAAAPLRDALERLLSEAPEVGEVVRYRIGPSVGAHTGPGTVGAMFYRRLSERETR